jgi:phosphatidylserine decarboxylase
MINLNFIVVFILSTLLIAASAYKWDLPFNKSFLIIFFASVLSILLSLLLSAFLGSIILLIVFVVLQGSFYIGFLLFLFFRDPERTPPVENDIVVSPADGTIIYIKEVKNGEILESKKKDKIVIHTDLSNSKLAEKDLLQIGISLLFTDVHINRSPIPGSVIKLKHRAGKFLSLRNKEAVDVNEKQTIVIENQKVEVGIVQIASRLVRRIESYIKEGEEIQIGTKIGMIKFGSQVDIFINKAKVKSVSAQVGDYVKAGETVICKTI